MGKRLMKIQKIESRIKDTINDNKLFIGLNQKTARF